MEFLQPPTLLKQIRSEHLIKVTMSRSQVHLEFPELPSLAEWGWERDGLWKQFEQLCHKPSNAPTSLSTIPVRRRVEGCASVQKQTFSVVASVLACMLVVDTATKR